MGERRVVGIGLDDVGWRYILLFGVGLGEVWQFARAGIDLEISSLLLESVLNS